jgi:hypothetical protein
MIHLMIPLDIVGSETTLRLHKLHIARTHPPASYRCILYGLEAMSLRELTCISVVHIPRKSALQHAGQLLHLCSIKVRILRRCDVSIKIHEGRLQLVAFSRIDGIVDQSSTDGSRYADLALADVEVDESGLPAEAGSIGQKDLREGALSCMEE